MDLCGKKTYDRRELFVNKFYEKYSNSFLSEQLAQEFAGRILQLDWREAPPPT